MRFPNPAVKLPAWSCFDRLDRWRIGRGILTGRWTQAELDEHARLAREDAAELRMCFDEPDDPGWYYLIDLDAGYTILKCPGDHDVASRHLRAIREALDADGRIGTTVRDPEGRTASLIGVYRPYTPREEAMYPKSYGFTPNLLGSIDTDPAEWRCVK